jgi:hypothetical protein
MTPTDITVPEPAPQSTRQRWWPFTRHYLEMVVAMVLGMVVLDPLWRLALWSAGADQVMDNHTTGSLIMASNMCIGMGAWMRHRGHAWRPILEMSAAMYVPFFVLMPVLWSDRISGTQYMVGAHGLMLITMLAAMLSRREEYSGHAHH